MILQIAGYALLLVVWSYVSIKALLRNQQYKEAAIYGGLMGVSAIIGCLLIAGVDVPSVVIPFKMVFEPFGKMILMQ